MLTYAVTTVRNAEGDCHEVDCHYFQDGGTFVYFKDDSNKTVLAVPAEDVVAIELKREHDGSAQTEVQFDVKSPGLGSFADFARHLSRPSGTPR